MMRKRRLARKAPVSRRTRVAVRHGVLIDDDNDWMVGSPAATEAKESPR